MTDKKVALITGAGRGIGKEIALRLAKDGFDIALNYRSNLEEAKVVENELSVLGADVYLVKGDVSKQQDCEFVFNSSVEYFGKVDVLVNNAGITKDNLILRMTEDDFDAVIETNLKSAFLMMKLAAKHMSKRREGRIIKNQLN